MAVVFEGADVATYATAGSRTLTFVNVSPASGDLLLFVYANSGGNPLTSDPSWTEVYESDLGTTLASGAFYKISDGTETSVSFSTATGNNTVKVLHFSGLASSSVLDDYGIDDSEHATASTTCFSGTATATQAAGYAVAAHISRDQRFVESTKISVDNSFSYISSDQSNPTNYPGIEVSSKSYSSTGDYSVTQTTTDTGDENIGWIFLFKEASGGATTVTLAQASESDSVQPITSRKIKSFGQATETDSAQAITPSLEGVIEVPLSQTSETDLAQAFTKRKIKGFGQVTETNESTRFTKAKNKRHNGPALETDTAQPITGRKIKAFGQASETDFAQAISSPGVKRVTVNQASETDAVQAIARIKRKAFGQVSETDLSQAVTKRKIKALGQNLEIDSAAPITFVGTKYIPLGQVVETDFAQPITAPSLAPPAISGGGGGWPFQVPYLKSELEKKPSKRKTEKAKPPKPVRDSLLDAIAQTLPEPAKEQEPITAIKPTEVVKSATVAAPVVDQSAEVAELRNLVTQMQTQIAELSQAVIDMQLELQQGLEDAEALAVIGATMGDL
jgi:hypothetical protein